MSGLCLKTFYSQEMLWLLVEKKENATNISKDFEKKIILFLHLRAGGRKKLRKKFGINLLANNNIVLRDWCCSPSLVMVFQLESQTKTSHNVKWLPSSYFFDFSHIGNQFYNNSNRKMKNSKKKTIKSKSHSLIFKPR